MAWERSLGEEVGSHIVASRRSGERLRRHVGRRKLRVMASPLIGAHDAQPIVADVPEGMPGHCRYDNHVSRPRLDFIVSDSEQPTTFTYDDRRRIRVAVRSIERTRRVRSRNQAEPKPMFFSSEHP
jgi:hypothetical protein